MHTRKKSTIINKNDWFGGGPFLERSLERWPA